MKVLYCLSHITKSFQWLWFAEEMKNRNIEQVYLIIDTNKGTNNYLAEDLKKMGFEVHLLTHQGKTSHISNVLKTISIIRKGKFDLIHTALPFGNLVGQAAAFVCRIKARVTTCENASWAHDFSSKKQEWIDKFTFQKAKKIIANSEISADYLRKNWKMDPSKLEVIYHGWKTSAYEVENSRVEKIKQELGIDKQNEFVVGVLARFEFWKGYEFILEAARLLKNYPEIKFYLFGSKATYYDEAIKKIKDYGLESKIKHTEFVVDAPALYQLFDVHLHVPVDFHVETGGLTIVDGMMAARPQILTLSGYAYQVARHMENAYVVPFQDANAIAQAVLWMKNNKQKATELGLQAKKDAIKMFDIHVKVNKHISLYNELLK
jgi:glycosyltransferase involved in cell wall biosynthesis